MIGNIFTPQIDSLPGFDNHEFVIFFQDKDTKLRGYIAIHNTNLGPATGGTRMHLYESDLEAITDVLNLSKAMSYKCALAGVPFGGGKAVIIADPATKTKDIFKAYGQKIEDLQGTFSTGTDAGITDEDVAVMASQTEYVEGARHKNKDTYNTSDLAALGVYYGIEVCLERLFNSSVLEGRTIAVKGLGKLGGELVRLLYGQGANLIIGDIDTKKEKEIKQQYPEVKIVDYRIIHKEKCDIFAPCALGNELTDKTVKELKAAIVCGGANNQLASDKVGDKLHKKEILYAPDYVVNAGGLINVVAEMQNGGYKKEKVKAKVLGIKRTLNKIFNDSARKNLPTSKVADAMAESLIYGK